MIDLFPEPVTDSKGLLAMSTRRLMPTAMATTKTPTARHTVNATLAVVASFDVHATDGITTTIRHRAV